MHTLEKSLETLGALGKLQNDGNFFLMAKQRQKGGRGCNKTLIKISNFTINIKPF